MCYPSIQQRPVQWGRFASPVQCTGITVYCCYIALLIHCTGDTEQCTGEGKVPGEVQLCYSALSIHCTDTVYRWYSVMVIQCTGGTVQWCYSAVVIQLVRNRFNTEGSGKFPVEFRPLHTVHWSLLTNRSHGLVSPDQQTSGRTNQRTALAGDGPITGPNTDHFKWPFAAPITGQQRAGMDQPGGQILTTTDQ